MKLSNVILSTLLVTQAAYAERFVVEDVRVEGLQRIPAGTFFNYLPVKRGTTIDDADFSGIIRGLYQTRFFEDIVLLRDGNALVVKVKENPIIGKINIEGNHQIKTKDLLKGMVGFGLGEGDVFDAAKLRAMEKELLNLYHSRSKFDVVINASQSMLNDGRVAINVDIKEGVSARIKQINIVGNQSFSEEQLLQIMKLSVSEWHSTFTRGDRYSAEILDKDIKTITNYYKDRGFIDFKINSTQVSLTDDKKYIYITINIHEGLPYRISGSNFSQLPMLSSDQLDGLLEYHVGDYYSQQQVRNSVALIQTALGDQGYANAALSVVPRIDRVRQEVQIDYAINPGRKAYVRRIEFTGNYSTNDEVLRREMRQMEGSVYNSTKLQRSAQRLKRLGYITSVNRSERAVVGSPDLIDVRYDVTETKSRSINLGIGYSRYSGINYTAAYQTANFFGSGNAFRFDFSKSDTQDNYSFSFTDPYFTPDGVSRTLSFFYNKTNDKDRDVGQWKTDSMGGDLSFGLPINEFESVSAGVGATKTNVKYGSKVAPEIKYWLGKHGTEFNEFSLHAGWMRDTRDQPIFSNEGNLVRVTAKIALPGSTETYGSLGLKARSYFRLHDKIIASVKGDISYAKAYGSSESVPFFKNYYAGGLGTVRGFRTNTLGPRWSNGDISGGTLRVTGGAELIFPWTLGKGDESVRVGAFTDFGNVYADASAFDAGEFKYSAGLFMLWKSPIGPLNLSYAIPLDKKPTDTEERFQFTIGVPF